MSTKRWTLVLVINAWQDDPAGWKTYLFNRPIRFAGPNPQRPFAALYLFGFSLFFRRLTKEQMEREQSLRMAA